MKREIKEEKLSVIEDIVKENIAHVGIESTDSQAALLLRLIFSGLGSHFFFEPDTKFRIGFIEILKTPDKDELFTVKIIRDEENSIINADTLYRYYKGELSREENLKKVLDTFVNGLLNYAQAQEISIASLADKISLSATNKKKQVNRNKKPRK